MEKGWKEMHKGADLKVPKFFRFIIKYVTPVYLLILLAVWTYQDAVKNFLMKDPENVHYAEPSHHPYLWAIRALMGVIFVVVLILVRKAWKRNEEKPEEAAESQNS
jgi:SNF family Na+-dependent transporter